MGLGTQSHSAKVEIFYRSQPWYGAYMAALFEGNAALIAPRIRLAERLIVARKCELSSSPADLGESRALQSALMALRELAICRKLVAS